MITNALLVTNVRTEKEHVMSEKKMITKETTIIDSIFNNISLSDLHEEIESAMSRHFPKGTWSIRDPELASNIRLYRWYSSRSEATVMEVDYISTRLETDDEYHKRLRSEENQRKATEKIAKRKAQAELNKIEKEKELLAKLKKKYE